MQFVLYLSPQKTVRYLILVVAILGLLNLAIGISTYQIDFYEEWMDMLDLDKEMNIPTWFSSFLLACCGFLLSVIARGKKNESAPYHRQWQLLSYIFWFMAVDEVFSFHEVFIIPEIAEALRLPWFLHSMWVIPGAAFVIWFGKKFWKFVNHLPKRARRHFISAAIVYVGGALVMEMIGSYYAEAVGRRNIVYFLMTTVEEMMEMVGIIILIYGLLVYLEKWMQAFQIQVHIKSAS